MPDNDTMTGGQLPDPAAGGLASEEASEVNADVFSTPPDAPEPGAVDLDLFALGEGDADDAGSPDDVHSEVPEGFALAEDCGIPACLHEGLGKLAADAGLDGKAAAEYLTRALEFARHEDLEASRQQAALLKEEWGSEFDDKLGATKRFIRQMGSAAGLDSQTLAVLASPNGMRLMNAVREFAGDSGRLPGNQQGAPALSAQQQIDAIYNNREDFAALNNPSDPRFKELNAKVNALFASMRAHGK